MREYEKINTDHIGLYAKHFKTLMKKEFGNNEHEPHKYMTFNKNKKYNDRFYRYYDYKNPIDLSLID